MTRSLPIAIQSFRAIRETDFYYVDKTPLIRRLVGEGRFYSCPGRAVSAKASRWIRCDRCSRATRIYSWAWTFAGTRTWSVRHPVVRRSFGGKNNEPEDLERSILNQMALIEHAAGLGPTTPANSGLERLQNVLYRLHHAAGRQVVVLVDEYDKPILDVLNDPDLATANRDYLCGFYGIIKDSAEHVRFAFVTGVSMFSTVSLFPGLNNLEDISLNPRYATVCGYTEDDLDRVFGPELDGLDREDIRTRYNGYH